MTNEQRLEMYIRKIVQKFVIKAKSGRYSTIWLVKEYHEIIDSCKYYYGVHPNDYSMYDRLPESLQEAIAREV